MKFSANPPILRRAPSAASPCPQQYPIGWLQLPIAPLTFSISFVPRDRVRLVAQKAATNQPDRIVARLSSSTDFSRRTPPSQRKARLGGGENQIQTRVAVRRTIALYSATKCVFRLCGNQRVPSGQSGRLHGVGSLVRNKRSVLVQRARIAWRADLTVPGAPIFLALVVVDMQAQTGGSTRIESYSASRMSKYVPGEKNTGVRPRST